MLTLAAIQLCSVCLKANKIVAKNMCASCYQKSRARKCIVCCRVMVIHAQGMCEACYFRLGRNSVKIKCARCGRDAAHYAKRMCRSCYNYVIIKKCSGVVV